MDYDRNKSYFQADPTFSPTQFYLTGAVLIVVGIVLLLNDNIILGLIVTIAGAGGLYAGNQKSRPITDNEIDAICQNAIANIKEKALSKLGVDSDETQLLQPIVIHGYYYKNIASQVLYKEGKDKRYRSSNYEVAVFFFTESHVYSYKYRFSLIGGEKNEGTDEYFYKDIVTVSTSSDSITYTLDRQTKTLNFEEFKLTTSGGTSITCSLWDAGYAEKSIQGMRQLIKQKKAS